MIPGTEIFDPRDLMQSRAALYLATTFSPLDLNLASTALGRGLYHCGHYPRCRGLLMRVAAMTPQPHSVIWTSARVCVVLACLSSPICGSRPQTLLG